MIGPGWLTPQPSSSPVTTVPPHPRPPCPWLRCTEPVQQSGISSTSNPAGSRVERRKGKFRLTEEGPAPGLSEQLLLTSSVAGEDGMWPVSRWFHCPRSWLKARGMELKSSLAAYWGWLSNPSHSKGRVWPWPPFPTRKPLLLQHQPLSSAPSTLRWLLGSWDSWADHVPAWGKSHCFSVKQCLGKSLEEGQRQWHPACCSSSGSVAKLSYSL